MPQTYALKVEVNKNHNSLFLYPFDEPTETLADKSRRLVTWFFLNIASNYNLPRFKCVLYFCNLLSV